MNVLANCGCYQFLRRVILSFVIVTLVIGASIAQDDFVCQASDIEQSVFDLLAEYHANLGADTVKDAVQDVESLIDSLSQIVNNYRDACIDGEESDSNDGRRNDTESESAGEGTFADPIRENWITNDGKGRWIGVQGYSRIGNEICTRPGGYCEEAKPGNEFIAVAVYGKCDASRRTRCEFYPYSEFELAGQRGIPYNTENMRTFDDVYTLFSEDILPGSISEGLVFFQAPENERDFIFGWTPDFRWETIWHIVPERRVLY